MGIGATTLPHYRGSDQSRTWVLPVPYLVYRGESLKVDDDRRLRGLFGDRLELEFSLNGSPPAKNNDARRGMPDLDATLEIGPSLNIALLRSKNAAEKLELRLPVRAVRYNQYFYAVDPIFAMADRPAFDPSGGYGGTTLLAALSKRFPNYWVGAFAKWDSVGGAVFADSPLVKSRSNFSGGLGIAWILGASSARVEAEN